ncbi:hypothetical protein HII17_09695 [Thalassotalea sp. M1531]|uniref:Uncharacterized protein n=1 Tax=Thalassotalea algicola TaxID=2716224 RepID=A0A7Y0LCM1_9GAMM|nr:hypothetical protein [Thalassotalea algicola]NMP31837.1 hypothetical protein [Thalassotalea algicola]
MSNLRPQDMSNLVNRYNPSSGAMQQQGTKPATQIPDELKNIINKIVTSIDGMYQFSGFKDATKVTHYKTELTKGLYKIRDKISEQNIKDALDLFRTKGGKFPPSVPEFIQAVLGEHEEQVKPPEHVWFDASKAIPKHTAEEMASFAKKGIADAKAALKKTPAIK